MPLYEYICDDTGEVIETIRTMAEADKPLPDPENRGRVFRRKHSTFQAQASTPRGGPAMGGTGPGGGGCGCGNPHGPCAR